MSWLSSTVRRNIGGSNNKAVQIAVTAFAAVATVATMGAAAPVVGAAVLGAGAEAAGLGYAAGVAVASEATILGGAATYGSVVGGAIIGAGAGALNGAAQASLVGADLADGIVKGAVVGSVSGVAGLVGAGYASEALATSGLGAELGEAGTAAVTGGVKGATANVVGAEMQGRDPLTAGLAGLVAGAATPAIGGLLNEGKLPTTDIGKITAATLGGGVSGATRGALTGTDPLLSAATGAAMGGVGAYLEPQITAGLANTLFGGASTTNVSEAVGGQLTREQHAERIRYLEEVQQQYAERGDEAGAQNIQNALDVARSQFEADLPRIAQAEQAESFQQTTPSVDITGKGGSPNIASTINDIYQRNFGRTAEEAGIQNWAQSGLTGKELESAIIAGAQGPDRDYYLSKLIQPTADPTIVDATKTATGGTSATDVIKEAIGETGAGGGVKDTTGAAADYEKQIAEEAQQETPTTDIYVSGPGGAATGGGGAETTTATGGGGGAETATGSDAIATGTDGEISTTNDMLQFLSDLAPSDAESADYSGAGGDGGDGEAGGDGGPRPTDPSQKRVVISPIYMDPVLRRRSAQSAISPVISSGLDPATSGVVLSKYGKKDQVWNEATLRLADALGIR
jgi:hypothetical protein